MERKHSVYKIVGPTGIYIGATKQKLINRWAAHKTRSKQGYDHPLSNAIREFGFELFVISLIANELTHAEAHELERVNIAIHKQDNNSYNISPGGDFDHITGNWIHWEKYDTDPVYREEYSKKLSEGIIKGKAHDYDKISKTALQWRKDNPKDAYKASYRALRIANKSKNFTEKLPETKEERKLRLLWKFKRGGMSKIQVTKVWANRDEETKQEIFSKISDTLKEKNKSLSVEEKMAMVSKARSCIDRSVQGPAASAGIKKFWVDLKADPVRFKAHMEAKTKKMMETRNREKNENL